MTDPSDLLLFDHLLRKSDLELDLERGALLIAEAEYPGLDVASYVARLDRLGGQARRRLTAEGLRPGKAGVSPSLGIILPFLYEEVGFRGNTSDYYDPKNSFLNEVLERRTGIPITLAVVLMGVCRRAGVDLQGISFPGHFLVRAVREDREPLYIDPFDGKFLEHGQLDALYHQTTGDPADIDERFLQPAGKRQILTRMLNNLRAIYEVRGDVRRLRQVLARMAILCPSDEVKSRLDLLGRTGTAAPRLSVN
jgi:regulator of sirC expression with transglutaminase-like and TPR domain